MICHAAYLHQPATAIRKERLASEHCGHAGISIYDAEAGPPTEAARKTACSLFLSLPSLAVLGDQGAGEGALDFFIGGIESQGDS